jgi:Uma2 family endonuclease
MSEKAVNQPGRKASMEDYILSERQSASRNEYLNGRIVGRSGSDRWHNLLVSNTVIGIGSRLQGHKYEIYVSNMRVKLKNDAICYPDIVMVNVEPAFADQNHDLLLNPTVVVDIFSNDTNTSDKARKLESFLATDSIKECVLLKQDEMRVEQYSRQNAKQWIYKIYNERDDVVSLESIGCKISLAEIYGQVKFRQAEFSSRAAN